MEREICRLSARSSDTPNPDNFPPIQKETRKERRRRLRRSLGEWLVSRQLVSSVPDGEKFVRAVFHACELEECIRDDWMSSDAQHKADPQEDCVSPIFLNADNSLTDLQPTNEPSDFVCASTPEMAAGLRIALPLPSSIPKSLEREEREKIREEKRRYLFPNVPASPSPDLATHGQQDTSNPRIVPDNFLPSSFSAGALMEMDDYFCIHPEELRGQNPTELSKILSSLTVRQQHRRSISPSGFRITLPSIRFLQKTSLRSRSRSKTRSVLTASNRKQYRELYQRLRPRAESKKSDVGPRPRSKSNFMTTSVSREVSPIDQFVRAPQICSPQSSESPCALISEDETVPQDLFTPIIQISSFASGSENMDFSLESAPKFLLSDGRRGERNMEENHTAPSPLCHPPSILHLENTFDSFLLNGLPSTSSHSNMFEVDSVEVSDSVSSPVMALQGFASDVEASSLSSRSPKTDDFCRKASDDSDVQMALECTLDIDQAQSEDSFDEESLVESDGDWKDESDFHLQLSSVMNENSQETSDDECRRASSRGNFYEFANTLSETLAALELEISKELAVPTLLSSTRQDSSRLSHVEDEDKQLDSNAFYPSENENIAFMVDGDVMKDDSCSALQNFLDEKEKNLKIPIPSHSFHEENKIGSRTQSASRTSVSPSPLPSCESTETNSKAEKKRATRIRFVQDEKKPSKSTTRQHSSSPTINRPTSKHSKDKSLEDSTSELLLRWPWLSEPGAHRESLPPMLMRPTCLRYSSKSKDKFPWLASGSGSGGTGCTESLLSLSALSSPELAHRVAGSVIRRVRRLSTSQTLDSNNFESHNVNASPSPSSDKCFSSGSVFARVLHTPSEDSFCAKSLKTEDSHTHLYPPRKIRSISPPSRLWKKGGDISFPLIDKIKVVEDKICKMDHSVSPLDRSVNWTHADHSSTLSDQQPNSMYSLDGGLPKAPRGNFACGLENLSISHKSSSGGALLRSHTLPPLNPNSSSVIPNRSDPKNLSFISELDEWASSVGCASNKFLRFSRTDFDGTVTKDVQNFHNQLDSVTSLQHSSSDNPTEDTLSASPRECTDRYDVFLLEHIRSRSSSGGSNIGQRGFCPFSSDLESCRLSLVSSLSETLETTDSL